jgi:hypothetical protein
MLREGLTITMEYREGNEPYAVRCEIPMHTIEFANKDFTRLLEYETTNMWRRMEKELFARD